jgi:hypothetical protein
MILLFELNKNYFFDFQKREFLKKFHVCKKKKK